MARRLAVAVAGALLGGIACYGAGRAARSYVAPRTRASLLERENFHGRTVSLTGGVAAAAGCVVVAGGAPLACSAARAGAGALPAVAAAAVAGAVDDLDQGAHDGEAPAKGLHGHLGALAQGRVTTGTLKIVIIGAGALFGGCVLARSRRDMGQRPTLVIVDAAVNAVTIASWANVHNLLDLRPGRALKAATAVATPLVLTWGASGRVTRALAWGVLGTAAAALPSDLREETMLGDTGANSVGALVGCALSAHPARRVRLTAAAAGTALVLASERVSFSEVIARHPLLSRLDALGRDGGEGQDTDDAGAGAAGEPSPVGQERAAAPGGAGAPVTES